MRLRARKFPCTLEEASEQFKQGRFLDIPARHIATFCRLSGALAEQAFSRYPVAMVRQLNRVDPNFLYEQPRLALVAVLAEPKVFKSVPKGVIVTSRGKLTFHGEAIVRAAVADAANVRYVPEIVLHASDDVAMDLVRLDPEILLRLSSAYIVTHPHIAIAAIEHQPDLIAALPEALLAGDAGELVMSAALSRDPSSALLIPLNMLYVHERLAEAVVRAVPEIIEALPADLLQSSPALQALQAHHPGAEAGPEEAAEEESDDMAMSL